MHAMPNWSSVIGLMGLLLWAGDAQAASCQNNVPPSNPDSVYIDHGDGTVTDTRTDLMWKQCAEGLSGANCENGSAQVFSWANALAHAEFSTFRDYTDWRLPNVKELSSLVEGCRAHPSINTNLFPNTPDLEYWSGSPVSENSSASWWVSFSTGRSLPWYLRSNEYRVRLVRGGQ